MRDNCYYHATMIIRLVVIIIVIVIIISVLCVELHSEDADGKRW